MSAKPTGLAAFTKAKGATAPAVEEGSPAKERTARKRAHGDHVALTVRIPRADWKRLHQLAMDQGTSLQALAIVGLGKVFEEHGLDPISS